MYMVGDGRGELGRKKQTTFSLAVTNKQVAV